MVSLKTADSTAIVMQFGCATDENGNTLPDYGHHATVLFFYPGGYDLARCQTIFDGFRKLGANVAITEYPGFGMSAGSASEAGCYAAADATYDYILSRGDLDRSRVFVVGWSVGGGVAIDLASRRSVAGLVAIATSTKIEDVVVELTDKRWWTAWIPRIVVRELVSETKLDSLSKIPRVTAPTLLIYGAKDDLVTEEMVMRMRRAATVEVKTEKIDGVSHRDFFAIEAPKLWNAIRDWLDANMQALADKAN